MKRPEATRATRYVALLRGVNVGGHKSVSVSALRDFMTALGLRNGQTLLQSGNLVFSAARESADALERKLEAEARKRLSLDADFFVRTSEEWAELVAHNPFPEAAADGPAHLLAFCLKDEPTPEALESLRAAIVGRERVAAAGRVLYVVYPDGIGRSKLTHALIEKKLEIRGTGRNWNTVLKLAAVAGRTGAVPKAH